LAGMTPVDAWARTDRASNIRRPVSPAISSFQRRSGSRECQLIYRGSGAREPPDRCKKRGSRASLSRWIPLDRSSSPWHRAHGFEPCRRRATPRFVPFGHRSSRHPSLNRGVHRITQPRTVGIQPIRVKMDSRVRANPRCLAPG
jgi:hypothetical protein